MSTTYRVFATKNFPLATYLLTNRNLDFIEAAVENGRVSFRFADPAGIGPKLAIEFESGAECPAVQFHANQLRLRRIMDAVLARSGALSNECANR